MTERSRPLISQVTGMATGDLDAPQAVAAIRLAGVFDEQFYLNSYLAADPVLKLVDPISHYLVVGYSRGYRPSGTFDSTIYLAQHPGIAVRGMNPLLHLSLHLLAERPRPVVMAIEEVSRSQHRRVRIPDFSGLQRPWCKGERVALDVVMPVHSGFHETLLAVHSVLSSKNKTPFQLIIIDDMSPDAELIRHIQLLARSGLITLLHNSRNLGFAGTVNKALALHPQRDVLLLNSDTMVYGNWVDRLAAHAAEGVATVTPFSNNASLCSYPRIFEVNTLPAGIAARSIDRLCATLNKGQAVELPTGVGFCMYVKRAAAQVIGRFDDKIFRTGYGEDNDFCFRAVKCGLRNLHALDVFVYHAGGVSFGTWPPDAASKPLAALNKKHPGFKAALRRFALEDPSLAARQLLDLALLTRGKQRVDLRHIGKRGMVRRKGRDSLLLYLCPEPGGRSVKLESTEGLTVSPNLTGLDTTRLSSLLKTLFPPGGKRAVRFRGGEVSVKNRSRSP
jgi:O-antigen biosynthesis protein